MPSFTRKTKCRYFSFWMPTDIRKSITFVGTPPGLARLPLPLHLAVNMTTNNTHWWNDTEKKGEKNQSHRHFVHHKPTGANPCLIQIYLQETPASNRPSHGKAKVTQHVYTLETRFVLHSEQAKCLLQALHLSRLSKLKTD